MSRDEYTTDRPMDWQDRVVIKGCAFVAMAFVYFVLVRVI